MSFLDLLASFWRHRHRIIWPLVLCPLLVLGWVISQPPMYVATAVLQVDTTKARSPLLQQITQPGHAKTLLKLLQGPELLADTARDAGMRIDARQVGLMVLSDNLIEITYTSGQKLALEQLVDALGNNFIYEVLAPERLRIEQRLSETGQNLEKIQRVLAAPETPAMDTPRLKLQESALTASYATLMDDITAVNAAFNPGSSNALIWFAQPARVVDRQPFISRVLCALWRGLGFGAAMAVVLVVWNLFSCQGFTSTTQLTRALGLSLLGTVPNIGTVQIHDGKASVHVGNTTLDPTNFTEITRLHRALTRNLHGALVLTSPLGQSGTTMMALLLALKSAATGKRTLLVDLNLKNGGPTRQFGLAPCSWEISSNKAGKGRGGANPLKNVIIENAQGSGVDVLPLPSDMATIEYLSQPVGASAVLDSLSSTYEHIIVDTTPIGAANRQNADPLSLAAVAPRSALVVLMRRTDAVLVTASANQLVASGANVAGVIANNVQNPTPKTLLMGLAATLQPLSSGLAQWLRARVIASGME